ncbi:MAG: hypothetical protein ACKVHG_09565 [Sphingomonadales bacterium]
MASPSVGSAGSGMPTPTITRVITNAIIAKALTLVISLGLCILAPSCFIFVLDDPPIFHQLNAACPHPPELKKPE